MSMTAKEAISYIENYGWSTTRLGLDRTKELLSALGNPERELKFIHVAGSNGKGSTCAMLASILSQAGYRTGLYISPYIQEFGERIQIDGENIPGDELAAITERVKAIADGMEDHPSQFELVTAIAIEYYRQQNCDLVVLEVGMGGALDSTNAIDAPEVAVITNIGLEHTEYLGDTLEEIAETKGGIIKTGSDCICYDGAPEVTKTIERICAERDVPFTLVDFSRLLPGEAGLKGQNFRWGNEDFFLPLLGPHQLHNASVVLEVIETLKRRGWAIETEAVRNGLAETRWPARFEVMTEDPVFILDGGHNPQCAEALTEAIKTYLPHERIVFLLGVLSDKDYGSIIDMMLPYSEKFITVTPVSERALSAEELKNAIEAKGGRAEVAGGISDGIRMALNESEKSGAAPIIAFGSLYLAGTVRTEFPNAYRRFLRRRSIKRREALTDSERAEKSKAICDALAELPELREAKRILMYKWTRGEVRLDELEARLESLPEGPPELLYPLCISAEEMIAVKPGEGEGAWKKGAFDIREPKLEEGRRVDPGEIDLVIAPASGFDESCGRLGMGGGYYDRFLLKCSGAKTLAVCFEVQKLKKVPLEPWDVPVDAVVTEDGVYRGSEDGSE